MYLHVKLLDTVQSEAAVRERENAKLREKLAAYEAAQMDTGDVAVDTGDVAVDAGSADSQQEVQEEKKAEEGQSVPSDRASRSVNGELICGMNSSYVELSL